MSQDYTATNVVTSSVNEYERIELKYMIPSNVVDIIVPTLLNYMVLDPFSKKADGYYDIYTVYFDTFDWQAFYSKMDGNLHRQKFRIRSYNPTPKPNEPVFIEIKEKHGNTIFKRRAPLSVKNSKNLLHGMPLKTENPVYSEWKYNLARNTLRPRLLNTYKRLAFVSEYFPGLRVTIDRDIGYAMSGEIDFNVPTRKIEWSHDTCVIEIKFYKWAPQFIIDMLRQYNLTMEPVSKYCYSVMSNYLLI